MTTIKNIPDSYTINVPTMTVNGDLFVTGNSHSVVTNNTSITDHLIVMNDGLSPGAGPNPLGANIIIDRGTSANVSLTWNEGVGAWQITNNGTTFGNIVAAAPSGNINITGATLYTTSSNGSVQIFANTAGSGGSGVYVTNTQTTDAELVTKAKAVAYSIVFG
jgi:hypothetical protein